MTVVTIKPAAYGRHSDQASVTNRCSSARGDLRDRTSAVCEERPGGVWTVWTRQRIQCRANGFLIRTVRAA